MNMTSFVLILNLYYIFMLFNIYSPILLIFAIHQDVLLCDHVETWNNDLFECNSCID